MKIEQIKYSDLLEVSNLQPSGWNPITPYIEYYLNSPCCYIIKAVQNSRIVGIGAAILHKDTSWVAHIIVHKDHRRQGIGKRIMEDLMHYNKEKNIQTIFLDSSEEGINLYLNLGFKFELDYQHYKSEQLNTSFEIPDFISPLQDHHIKEVLKLDFLSSGEDRSLLLKNEFKGGMVYSNNKKVEGFYLPYIGEGLVVANNNLAGLTLLNLKSCSKKRIGVSAGNPKAIEWLKENNFTLFDKSKRMFYGAPPKYQAGMIYSRTSGKLG